MVPYPVAPAGNAGLIGAVANPYDNWAARSAARQEALQLQGVLTAEKEQEALQQQQAAAQMDSFLAATKALPFMGRDVQKIHNHLKGEEQQLLTRLHDDYQGDVRKWYAAEGPAWEQGVITRLTQSPLYQQATLNRQNVLAAQEAVKKGEYLVGHQAPTQSGYATGEQQLQDFLSGRADTFDFRGSYKPDDDLKSIREEYAPGVPSWIPTKASEDVKLNRLIQLHGQEKGMDMYLRHYKDSDVLYKYDPAQKAIEFAMQQGRYQMDQGRYVREGVLANDRLKTNAVTRKLSQAHIDKLNRESWSENPNETFDYTLLGKGSTHQLTIAPDSQEGKKLPVSGIDLAKTRRLVGTTLFGNLSDAVAQQIGLGPKQETDLYYDSAFGSNKVRVQHYGKGNVKEGFIDANGVHPIDLSHSDYVTTGFEPVLFMNPRNIESGYLAKDAKGKTISVPNHLKRDTNGFVKMTIRFKSKDDAAKAGVFSNTTIGSVPKGAIGAYNKETRELTFYGNIGHIDRGSNPNLTNQMIKLQQGQKQANEDYGAPSLYFDTDPNQ